MEMPPVLVCVILTWYFHSLQAAMRWLQLRSYCLSDHHCTPLFLEENGEKRRKREMWYSLIHCTCIQYSNWTIPQEIPICETDCTPLYMVRHWEWVFLHDTWPSLPPSLLPPSTSQLLLHLWVMVVLFTYTNLKYIQSLNCEQNL